MGANAKNLAERTANVPTLDGTMETFVVHPAGRGAWPVVVLFMDALGIREELRDMARRNARQGYYALMPNLFYRAGGLSFDPSGLPDRVDPRMEALNHGTTHAMVLGDTRTLLDFAAADPHAADGPVGCIGFCMGGRHAYAAAGTFPARIRAAAAIHGGFLVTDKPDSPHLLTPRIQGEVYFGFADGDPVAPRAHMGIIDALLAEHNVRGLVEMHDGSRHGFIFPQRFCYDERAAERVWTHWFAMLRREIG